MKNQSLAARMKSYETHYRQTLLPNAPYIVRLDGRKFETYAKALNLHQPYDELLRNALLHVAKEMGERTKASFVYTVSDEITLGFASSNDAMFNGRTDKINSTFASLASVLFNNKMNEYFINKLNNTLSLSEMERNTIEQRLNTSKSILPTFDCRVFSLPNKYETLNNLLWREQDTAKQDLVRYASNHFKFNEIKGLTFEKLNIKLFEERNIDWSSDIFQSHRDTGVLYLEGVEDIDVQKCIMAWHLFQIGIEQMKLNFEERDAFIKWINLFRTYNPFTFGDEAKAEQIKEFHKTHNTHNLIVDSWFNYKIIQTMMYSGNLLIGDDCLFNHHSDNLHQTFKNDYKNLFNEELINKKINELHKLHCVLPEYVIMFTHNEAQHKLIEDFREKYHEIDLMGRLIDFLRQTSMGKESGMLDDDHKIDKLKQHWSKLYDKPFKAPIYELLDWHYYLWQYCIFLSDIPMEKLTTMTHVQRRCLYSLDIDERLSFRNESFSNISPIKPLLKHLDYHELESLFFTFDKSDSKQKLDVQFDE